jgi:hypothetical protein
MGVVGFIPYDSPPMQKNSGRNKVVTTLDRGARACGSSPATCDIDYRIGCVDRQGPGAHVPMSLGARQRRASDKGGARIQLLSDRRMWSRSDNVFGAWKTRLETNFLAACTRQYTPPPQRSVHCSSPSSEPQFCAPGAVIEVRHEITPDSYSGHPPTARWVHCPRLRQECS